MVNLSLQQQHQQSLKGQMTKKDSYQDWIQWVEAKKYEQISSSFLNLVHYVQVPRITGSSDIANASRDENRWTKICAKI